MSDLVERIKNSVKEHSYPIVHGINNHDEGMTVQGFYQVLDEESAKETQECEMRTAYDNNGIAYLVEAKGSEAKHIIELLAKESQECEWKRTDDYFGIKMYDICDGKATIHSGFKYCPYCGRKIKVIE